MAAFEEHIHLFPHAEQDMDWMWHYLEALFQAKEFSKLEPRLRYGATRAHNRHMAEFCKTDSRMIGVAAIPLDEPELALAELDWALAQGLGAVWVPHRAPLGRLGIDPALPGA